MKAKLLLTIIIFSCLTTAYAENISYDITSDAIGKHIEIIAHDSLEGRFVGSDGERKAASYIKSIFESAGLEPLKDSGYYQYYDFIRKIDFGHNNNLFLNKIELTLGEDYFPLKQSNSSRFLYQNVIDVDYGLIIPGGPTGGYNDYKDKDVTGQAVLIKRYAPKAAANSHVDFSRYSSLVDKINNAIKNKAGAIFFYTPEGENDLLDQEIQGNITQKDIPILYLTNKGLAKLSQSADNVSINLIAGQTELVKKVETSQNVIGYLKGNSDTTIIIGAHYDHIGYGEIGSRYKGEEPMVHNGADDNASGVSALLELARYYSNNKDDLPYSLLFIAFGGEEFGLLGSSYFGKHMTVDSSKVRMMINLDMIGRIKDQENQLAILGIGTAAEFKPFFDSLSYDDLDLALKNSGTGPSDHTIFYNRDIPVLHFFTGPHEDYNTPNDDADKIDNDGIVKVTGLIREIISYFNLNNSPLTFQKTKDSSEGKRRSKFTVSLGIMPDYVSEGKGVTVEGVIDERPAAMAGILKGDIIIKLGDFDIDDIYDYMNALGKFKKEQMITAVVLRDNIELKLEVAF